MTGYVCMYIKITICIINMHGYMLNFFFWNCISKTKLILFYILILIYILLVENAQLEKYSTRQWKPQKLLQHIFFLSYKLKRGYENVVEFKENFMGNLNI